jgi:D-alanyl-D-alanine carboxypeptidase/D-alanyl-D-alanine-endopeptidase (penicillin-binding protein 4)
VKGLVTLISLLLLSSPIFASTNTAQKIDRLVNKNHRAVLGILITKAGSGKTIYQKNAQRNFVPASNLKLLTGLATLLQLGPGYRYTTAILANKSKIKNGILNGKLYIQFSGDPSLTSTDLKALIVALKKQGVHQIADDIVIDKSVFDDQPYASGWMWDDINVCYSAPLSGANLDHNCFRFTLTPSKHTHGTAIIKHLKKANYFNVSNSITSQNKPNCSMHLSSSMDNHYVLSGCVHATDAPYAFNVAVKNPLRYITHTLRDLLQQQGISFAGHITLGKTPKKLNTLAAHDSAPLSTLLKKMLRSSDNLYADAFFKTLGHVQSKAPGSWDNGSKALKSILHNKENVDFSYAEIIDGSGLSRYTLLSPQLIVNTLNAALQDVRVNFKPYLAQGGTSGTLRGRKRLPRSVRAKTGSMENISSLSGYVNNKKGQTLSFSIISNNANFVKHNKKVEDTMMRILNQSS